MRPESTGQTAGPSATPPQMPRTANSLGQVLLGFINAFRALITQIGGEPADPRLQGLTSEVANVFDQVGQAVTTLEDRINQMSQSMTLQNQQAQRDLQQVQNDLLQLQRQGPNQSQSATSRPMYESKSVANLKVLGSNKSDFKNWNEKLINATTQSVGPDWRKFIRSLNEKLDLERKVLTGAEIAQVPRAAGR